VSVREQMYLAYSYTYNAPTPLQRWKVYAVHLFTVLSYANSAVNPVIYGFTNDFFRKSFTNVFGCRQQPSPRRSGTVPRRNDTVSAHRQSAQCRPSRRMVTTLSGRPDLFVKTTTDAPLATAFTYISGPLYLFVKTEYCLASNTFLLFSKQAFSSRPRP